MITKFNPPQPVRHRTNGVEAGKIKVAYFIPVYRGAAMARWACNIVDNLDSEKYEVSFVGLKMEESFKSEISRDVFIVDLDNFYVPGIFFKLIRYFLKEQPDIFVSAFPHINTVSMMAKVISMVKTKIILTEHNNFFLLASNTSNAFRRFFALFIMPHLMRIFYPLADSIVCVSNGVAESILDVVDVKDKIKIIYNPVISDTVYRLSEEPVDHSWFVGPFDTAQNKQKIPVILAVGRLVNQKDYPTLLSAFSLVIQKMPAYLVILGEGPEQKKLEKISLELGISKSIAFLGLQKNPFKYMKKASIFVLSSLHEGFGNVIVEAMACGTPVISTDCKSGPGEIIEHGKNGILVPVGDCKSLSEAIIRVLEDPFLRQNLSVEGIKRSGYFSAERGMKQYEEVFLTLMNRPITQQVY